MAKDLIDAIDRVIRFLEAHKVDAWPDKLRWLRDDIVRIDPKDFVGLRLLVSKSRILGGMGSLNDLYICRANGHDVQDEKQVNSQFMSLVDNLRRAIQAIQ